LPSSDPGQVVLKLRPYGAIEI